MIWRAGVARFRAGAQAAISVQSPDSGLRNRNRLKRPSLTWGKGLIRHTADQACQAFSFQLE